VEGSSQHDRPRLERAVLRTVAYGDVFDAPVTVEEIHRYLDGFAATRAEVEAVLADLVPRLLARVDGHVCLADRQHLVAIRQRRERVAARLWPRAVRAGRAVAGLPFVRMVGVTGALAMSNVDDGADIDLLIVTEPGRVWLCRSLVIQLVRLLRLRGTIVCPNWLMSTERLELERRELHSARELTQMVPLAGMATYLRMRRANDWTLQLLPNAVGAPGRVSCAPIRTSIMARVGESLLASRVGDALERWECRRKIREIGRLSRGNPEVVLDRHQCKGHVDGHGRRIAEAYSARLESLSLAS
jgi:hypothetical protein